MLERAEKTNKAAFEVVGEIYRPIMRGYFAAFALYYLVMLPTHFWSFTGMAALSMITAAALAAGVGVFGFWFLRKPQPEDQITLLITTLNLLVVANILIALNIGFDQAKLVYFVIIAIGFAFANISLRQSLISLGAAFLAFVSFAPRLDPQSFVMYGFVAIGAAIASVAIAHLLRSSMHRIAKQQVEAEENLEQAHTLSAKLEAKSLSDSLTNLPNRRAFFTEMRKTMDALDQSSGGEETQHFWLVLLDLDGFKAVNDVHGHLTGDLLLKQVAVRLKAWAGEGVFISRMGGDEFNIVIRADMQADEIRALCEKLLGALSDPYLIEERHVRISASIGYKWIDPSATMHEQISQADFALMHAKKHGRNCAVIFNDELAGEAAARARVEHALRRANLYEELDLVYQPQLNLHSEKIVRAEVLARWNSRSIGPVEPDRFITIAEESGLITQISLVMVEKAFREVSQWPLPLPISLNLSGHDVISTPTVERVIELAHDAGIDPSRVEFEVTETAMMTDAKKAIANLEILKAEGFSIALDDFGTGYSNFSHLRSLPITKLKVDRSFLENPGDPMTEKILSSLAGMARILGVHCLLEGIEDEIGLLMARRAGAESVQGYLFGRPMGADQLLALIKANPANDADPDTWNQPATEQV